MLLLMVLLLLVRRVLLLMVLRVRRVPRLMVVVLLLVVRLLMVLVLLVVMLRLVILLLLMLRLVVVLLVRRRVVQHRLERLQVGVRVNMGVRRRRRRGNVGRLGWHDGGGARALGREKAGGKLAGALLLLRLADRDAAARNGPVHIVGRHKRVDVKGRIARVEHGGVARHVALHLRLLAALDAVHKAVGLAKGDKGKKNKKTRFGQLLPRQNKQNIRKTLPPPQALRSGPPDRRNPDPDRQNPAQDGATRSNKLHTLSWLRL
jgi:hypothetical protein